MGTLIWQNINKIHVGHVGRVGWFNTEWAKMEMKDVRNEYTVAFFWRNLFGRTDTNLKILLTFILIRSYFFCQWGTLIEKNNKNNKKQEAGCSHYVLIFFKQNKLLYYLHDYWSCKTKRHSSSGYNFCKESLLTKMHLLCFISCMHLASCESATLYGMFLT